MKSKLVKAGWLGLGLGAAALVLTMSQTASAGDVCVNCHTMHNSQNNAVMGTAGTNPQLLLSSSCLGCHTGTNNGTTVKHHVLTTAGAPTATQLAGGNFYWTDQADNAANDAKAHNVTGLTTNSGDTALGDTPPGAAGAMAGNITCAATTGCHGKRTTVYVTGADEFSDLGGAHHANTSGQISLPTVGSPGTGYRFLDGIKGYEVANREYETDQTAASHNEYYGANRANDSDSDTATISSLCAQCHPNFHNDSGGQALGSGASNIASPWLRHPTDIKMNNASEYAAYYTAGYSVLAPVARSAVPAASSATVDAVAGTDAIVMCLSCHKAHGSEYADILRWDYDAGTTACVSEIGAGPGAGCGCFKCHSGKD
ncbi:MAG: hypothetical protein A2521_08730 [Deltaproteobacteria bacterium RIFOXYD12_FULL_57_12]|nr:MAG: hypothetical protein A2521_08730 [Deltaproteobacteria bacterium RIFOXYD12_FULL_57_12]